MCAYVSVGALFRKAALSVLSVVLILSCLLLLPACQGDERRAELPSNPFDGTEAARLVASGAEGTEDVVGSPLLAIMILPAW
jgi:hypothetical protein